MRLALRFFERNVRHVMENVVVWMVLILAVGYGVYAVAKRMQGQSSCCGGAQYKVKKKKLAHVLYQKTFLAEGMHCNNCKMRVEETINDIAGAAGRVNLKKAN